MPTLDSQRSLSTLASTSLLLRSVNFPTQTPDDNSPISAWSDDELSDLDETDEAEISLDDEGTKVTSIVTSDKDADAAEREFGVLFSNQDDSSSESGDTIARPDSPNRSRFHPVVFQTQSNESDSGPIVRIAESHPSARVNKAVNDRTTMVRSRPVHTLMDKDEIQIEKPLTRSRSRKTQLPLTPPPSPPRNQRISTEMVC